jgi:hypothetical protein
MAKAYSRPGVKRSAKLPPPRDERGRFVSRARQLDRATRAHREYTARVYDLDPDSDTASRIRGSTAARKAGQNWFAETFQRAGRGRYRDRRTGRFVSLSTVKKSIASKVYWERIRLLQNKLGVDTNAARRFYREHREIAEETIDMRDVAS